MLLFEKNLTAGVAKIKNLMYNNRCYPPVAKLDIAVDSDSKGRGFESLRAGQNKKGSHFVGTLFIFVCA